ncbi:MAG: PilZ domain-containing protein [Myxococcota bacterium]
MDDPRESAQGRVHEQRRSRRYAAELTVFLHTRERHHPATTVNVARHGMLVATDVPLGLRHLVQLTVHLPTGPIRATASVARVVKLPVTGLPAVGVQFFALSADAKRNWDRYVSSLNHAAVDGVAALDASVAATFLLKFKDRASLLEYCHIQVERGEAVLHTPVFRAVGEEVSLVLVHPHTDEEFGLPGRVASVHRDRPKRMVIELLQLDERQHAALMRFVDTGVGSREGAYQYAPPDWRPDEPPVPPHGVHAADGDIPTLELPEHPELDGDTVGHWEVGEGQGEPGAVTLEVEAPRGQDPNLAAARVLVDCGECQASQPGLLLGDVPGVLAPVVELCPVYCEHCRRLSTVRRLKTAAGREQQLESLGGLLGGQARATVPMSMLFEVAALGGPAVCPRCRGTLRITPLVDDVSRAISRLRLGQERVETAVRCHRCRRGNWRLKLQR